MQRRIRIFCISLAVAALASVTPAWSQISVEKLDNVQTARQALEAGDLWSAKDHLEREQMANPGNDEVRNLLNETYGKLATKALIGNDASEATAFADKALEIQPDQIELIYTKARAAEALADYDQAIRLYERALVLNGKVDFKNTQQRLVHLYKTRGSDYLQKGNLAAAEKDFLGLVGYAREDADANYYLGYISLQNKQYDRARAFLDIALREKRLMRLSQMYYGMVEAETKHWAQTVKWMREARTDETLRPQTDPYLLTAHYNLGVDALQERQLDEANKQFQDVLRLNADHIDTLFNMGMTWDFKGDLERSREYYTRVRELRAGHRDVEAALADVDYRIALEHYKADRNEKAYALLREAATLAPTRGDVHYHLGMIHRRWKEDGKALPEFLYAISRNAFLIESRFEAGEIVFLGQDWQRTIDFLSLVEQENDAFRADKLKSYLREAWWKLGLADIQGKQWVAAEKKLKMVLNYPPDLPETHYYLGLAALKQGHFDTAVSELEPALKKLPKDVDLRRALSEAHYQLGLAAYAQQRYRDADKALARAREVEPSNLDAQYQLSRTWNELSRFEEAIPVLEKLSKREPPFRDSLDSLSRAYGGYGEQLLDKKQKRQASVYLKKALKINPVELSALYGLGVISEGERRYQEAADYLRRVYDRRPDYRRAYSLLIEVHWQLGLRAYDKKQELAARKNFLQVLDLDPNHGEALYHMGDLEVNAKNYDVAKSYFERAINRRTKLVESHYGLGTVLYELKDFAEAVESFEKTVELKPKYKNVDSYLRRAVYNEADQRYRKGDELGSAIYYEKFFKLEPKSAETALKLAGISEKAGLTDQAMKWYEAAIPIMKSDADPVRFKLAMLAYKNQAYERALRTVKRMKSKEAQELHGTILLAVGRRDREAGNQGDALANFKLALLKLPDNADVLFELGRVWHEKGNMSEAAENLKSSLEIEPDRPEALELAADAFRKLGADAFAKERLDVADRMYKTSKTFGPSIEAEYHIGVIAFLKGDLGTAYDHLTVVADEDARYKANRQYLKDVVCGLGQKALDDEDFVMAKSFVGKCADLNPADWTLRYKLAKLAFDNSNYHEAKSRFRDISLNMGGTFPDARGYYIDALYAVHQAYFEAGEYERAMTAADELVRQEPDAFRAHFALAVTLEKLERFDEAETALRKVLELRPGMDEAATLLKQVLAAKAPKPQPAGVDQ